MSMRPLPRGFTLIELLVVIAIIGLLSAIVLASLNTARTKGQDAARISDIKSLETAMELYYNDHNAYPHGGGGADGGIAIANLAAELVPTYIASIPTVLVADGDQYAWGSPYGYGLWVYTASGNGFCRAGMNVNPGWWGSPAICNF
jgi:prepilin-type N-terminal cleavage/methylation domain-containing protein